jgi:hypothetical protein
MVENQTRRKPQILLPWDVREAIFVAEAAKIAGCSLVTLRTWASLYGLGRRIGGRWMLSRVALTMYLDGDAKALAAYLGGDRESELVIGYFERCGLSPVMSTVHAAE